MIQSYWRTIGPESCIGEGRMKSAARAAELGAGEERERKRKRGEKEVLLYEERELGEKRGKEREREVKRGEQNREKRG